MTRSKNQEQKIKKGYAKNVNRYDSYITSGKWWSKIVVKIIWGLRDEEYVNTLLPLIPNKMQGRLLDIPVGTAIFTYENIKT